MILWIELSYKYNFLSLSPQRSWCVLISVGSGGGPPYLCPLLQKEPENGRTPQETRTPAQEPRCRLPGERGEPQPHWSPSAAHAVAAQAEEETPQPPQQLHLREWQRQRRPAARYGKRPRVKRQHTVCGSHTHTPSHYLSPSLSQVCRVTVLMEETSR